MYIVHIMFFELVVKIPKQINTNMYLCKKKHIFYLHIKLIFVHPSHLSFILSAATYRALEIYIRISIEWFTDILYEQSNVSVLQIVFLWLTYQYIEF